MKRPLYLIVLLYFLCFNASGQSFGVKGKILDSVTEDPVPFATVSLKGFAVGTNTDFEGNFTLSFEDLAPDSILVSSMGYDTKTVSLQKDSSGLFINNQNLTVKVNPGMIQLAEVVVRGGENPAWRILRKVVDNRDDTNFKKLDGYEHQSYNKVEIDVNKVNPKLDKRKITQKINEAVESVGTLTDDDGEKLLPMFISESISNYYFLNKPRLSKEVILKTNVKGIAVTDGSLTSQLIGSTFQQYNFYDNQISVLQKNFTSPIGNDWKSAYEYYLVDSFEVDHGDYFYEIQFEPKRKQDLVFTGWMWISKDRSALAMIDATITKDANLNFIERIKIQQELEAIDNVYFPTKNRVLVDVSEITSKSPGLLLKFTNYNDSIKINAPRDLSFFKSGAIQLSDDYLETDVDYWQSVRPEPFSQDEKNAYMMIDSIKAVPVVKRISSLIDIASSGHINLTKGIDFGPIVKTFGLNDLEGLRLRLGFRTDIDFSNKWVLKAFTAYGFKDKGWKGGTDVTRIFSKSPWTTLNVGYQRDLEQVGFSPEEIGSSTLYGAAVWFGTLFRPYYQSKANITFQRDISKGVTAKIGFENKTFEPLYNFSFFPNASDISNAQHNFTTSSINTELTFARDQLSVVSDNDKLDFGTVKSPTVTLAYKLGLKDIMGSDFSYHSFALRYKHKLNFGYFGKTYYRVEAGKIFGDLPYPLLKNHLGNETVISVSNSFNLMNNSEFLSDEYAYARFYHDFEGLFFNRFPLIKKLKLRTFASGKFLIGSLSNTNFSGANQNTEEGFLPIKRLDPSVPYTELSYGISNIFRFLKVEAVHRLTYLEGDNTRKFGVKVAAELSL
ncbi:DUF5686 and carboxypeptidase-like regulatory domain-containing protein [Arcticibacterium luteifluviistationis]|uniref:Carboxypeptidase-like regulatory domain-containing protein n=1 Tax=Arcticibacterium luteifluviistationis TaxID=1784714 RepID=A0A2Z4G6Z0_9BACT|nr:DUF5686 and carboxypeptidase-like regulatory domain-containing protein [Arcticibacterium luteifluviistationis]AWV96927.1 hypothetical protein DJ013_01540 [Arcticibacterium luteifluviistationis]